jgi:hypothetical protein
MPVVCSPMNAREHEQSRAPEPRVKGGREPGESAPLRRGAGAIRWRMVGCDALAHPTMRRQADG